jgi:hypothetical protein
LCTDLADGYDADRAANYRYEGGALSIRAASEPTITAGTAEVALVLDQAAVTVFDPNGKVVAAKTSEAYALTGGISLLWDSVDSTWRVTQLTAERQ